jgi:hypothetical protein
VPFFKLFELNSCKNIPEKYFVVYFDKYESIPPIPPRTLASHILFACVVDGCSLAPRPYPCMLVKVAFNNATTFYVQTCFISKHSSKIVFTSLTRILLYLKAMGPMMCSP